MRHVSPLLLSLLFCCSLFLSACEGGGKGSADSGPTPEEIITGSWKLKSLNTGNQPVPPQIMATSSFNFYKDGRYEILMGELDRGTWKLSQDKRSLITIPENGQGMQNFIDIERITPEEVVLYNSQAPQPIRMVLVPA